MKTDIYIVTGFLGAGKTTLVKNILSGSADLSKTIVVVNEFGKIGIDRALIQHTAAADIVELTSGCICCSLKTDMIQTLQILRHKYAPERIVIEATGVADPLSIMEALKDRLLAPHFRLKKTITIVDCDFWEARQAFGSVFKSQLHEADIILLNKIDTCDPSEVPIILKEIKQEYAKGVVIPSLRCNMDPDLFWSATQKENLTPHSLFQAYDPAHDFSRNPKGSPTAKEAGFTSFSFESHTAMDEDKFTCFLTTQPLELFRIKGPVRFSNRTRMLNYVGGKIEWQKWPDTIPTGLAFIGWGVVEEQILAQLTACLVRTEF